MLSDLGLVFGASAFGRSFLRILPSDKHILHETVSVTLNGRRRNKSAQVCSFESLVLFV